MWPGRGKHRGPGGALGNVGIQPRGQVLGVSRTPCPELIRASCPPPHRVLCWLLIQLEERTGKGFPLWVHLLRGFQPGLTQPLKPHGQLS